MTRGIVYVLTGNQKMFQEICYSIHSLRRIGYGGEILVISDMPQALTLRKRFDVKVKLLRFPGKDGRTRSRWVKTQIGKFTPFDRTLFLDSDILALQNFDHIWNIPGGICAAIDNNPTISDCNHGTDMEVLCTKNIIGDDKAPHYNTGVLLFDKEKMVKFCKFWHEEWKRYEDIDQLAFARVIYFRKEEMDFRVLDEDYNFFDHRLERVMKHRGKIIFLHNLSSHPEKILEQFPSPLL